MHLFLAAALLLNPPRGAQIIDRLAAVVAGQPITLSDVNAALALHLVDIPPDAPNRTDAALEQLIDRTLMLTEVDRFQPPEPAPEEITSRMDAMRRQAGSDAAFTHELEIVGMTQDRLRRFIRDDLRTATYLNRRFGDSSQRAQAVASWIAQLRRRSEITILLHGL